MEGVTMSDRYRPEVEELANGVISLDYGRAHAARDEDARALLDEIAWAKSAIVLTVRCGEAHDKKRPRLATVYRTSPPVIRIDREDSVDPALVQLRAQAGNDGIEYAGEVFVDILTAPDDRDLEVRCADHGRVELDRSAIVEAFDRGDRDLLVPLSE